MTSNKPQPVIFNADDFAATTGWPDLTSYGSNADVKTKPGGKTKDGRKLPPIKYVPWATIAAVLREKAPGWDFNLRVCSDNRSHAWISPGGFGYIVGFFTGPEGQQTADFPYAITDYYNRGIKWEAVTAQDLCNAHRRGMCAAAAFSFGLYYALWSGLEIKENDENAVEGGSSGEGLDVPQAPVQVQPKGKKLEDIPLNAKDRESLLEAIQETGNLAGFRQDFSNAWRVPKEGTVSQHIQTQAQGEWISEWLSHNPPAKKGGK